MDEGYILSNKFRKSIFEGFASGETNVERIAKKNRIFPAIAKKITKELVINGLVEQKGDNYYLTKDGEKIAAKIID